MSRSKPKQNELLESIATWTEEEQQILERNIINYPADKYTEFKRLALLLTDLQSKRLRDVSLRLQYMKRKEESPTMTWDEFIKYTISPRPKSERLKRDSPISSGKNSPRTPKAVRDISESPSDSPRYKKPIIQQRKVVGQLSTGVITTSNNNSMNNLSGNNSLNNSGNSIITSQQIKSNDPQQLLKRNERLLDKMDMLIASNRLYDMKEFAKFYNNCNDIIELTEQMAKPNALPAFTKEPLIIQEKDFNGMVQQHGNRSFNVPGIGMDLSPRSPYRQYNNPNYNQYTTSNGQVHQVEMCTSPLFIESPRNSNQNMSVISGNTNSVSTQMNNQGNINSNVVVPMNSLITQPNVTSGMNSILTTTPNIGMTMNHSMNNNLNTPINIQINQPINTKMNSNLNNNLNNNNQMYMMNQQQIQQQPNPSTMSFNPINLVNTNPINSVNQMNTMNQMQPMQQYPTQMSQQQMMQSNVMNPMYTQQIPQQSQQMMNVQQPITQPMHQPTYTTQFRLVTSEQPYHYQHVQQQTLQRPPKSRSLTGTDTMYDQMNYQQQLSQSQQMTSFNVNFDNGDEYAMDQPEGFISNTNNGLTISHLSK